MGIIALDFETSLIKDGEFAPRPICLSYARSETDYGLLHSKEGLDFFEKVLLGDESIVGANLSFDLGVLVAARPAMFKPAYRAIMSGRCHDVLLAQKIIDSADDCYRGELVEDEWVSYGYSLAKLVHRYFEVELDKTTWRTSYEEWEHLPLSEWPEGARQYAISDSIYTWQVFAEQQKLPTKVSDNVLVDRQIYDWVLHCMSRTGIEVDPKALEDLRARLGEAIEGAVPQLAACKILKNVSTKVGQVDLFTGEIMGPEWKTDQLSVRKKVDAAYNHQAPETDKGNTKIDFMTCAESGDPDLELFGTFTRHKSTLNGLASWADRERIHTRFDSYLVTGRVSSSNPNLQNLGRTTGVRELFTAPEGYLFAIADFSAAELHTLSQAQKDLLGSSVMGDALNQGLDLHSMVGAQLGSTSYDWVLENKGTDKTAALLRQAAKVANFGLPGRMGFKTFAFAAKKQGVDFKELGERFLKDATDNDVNSALWRFRFLNKYTPALSGTRRENLLNLLDATVEEFAAWKIRKAWMATWPDMKQYFDAVAQQEPYAITRTGLIRRSTKITELCNFHFQSLAASGMGYAASAVWEACYITRELSGCKPLLAIHDELIMLTPEEGSDNNLDRMERIMQEAFNKATPDYPTPTDGALKKVWKK